MVPMMTVSDPQLVTILVFAMAGLLLLQTLFLLVFMGQVNRRVRKAEKSVVKISKEALETLRTTRSHLEKLSWIKDKLPLAEREITLLLDHISERIRQVNETSEQGLEAVSSRVVEIGRRSELTLNQFLRQSSQVRKWIRYPGLCASAVVHGLFVGLRAYFRHSHEGQPATHLPDEEIFI
jgi:hypothetical protein